MPTEPEQQEQELSATDVEKTTAGTLLRSARVEHGLDEKQVADQLRITAHYIKAIEADRYEKLPGAIFARGYIKSYAKLLQLDAQDIVARYEATTASSSVARQQAEATEAESAGPNGARWALVSVVAVAVLFIGVWVVSGPTVESTEVVTSESGGRTAPERDTESVSNPITAVERSVADEPTLPVPDYPATRTNPGPAVVSMPESDGAERQAAAVEATDDPEEESVANSAASVEADGASADATTPARDTVASNTPASAAETAQPEPASEPVAPQPEQDQAEESSAATGQSDELVAINVLEGDNGERIIAVDASGNDVLRISFSGESWVEVNDADQRLIYRDLRESGDILEVTGRAPFNILLGDAPLTSMRLNGNAIDVSDDIRIDNSARLTVGL